MELRLVFRVRVSGSLLQHEDVLLVGVRRGGGAHPRGGQVEVEAVGQPEGVESRQGDGGQLAGDIRGDIRGDVAEMYGRYTGDVPWAY